VSPHRLLEHLRLRRNFTRSLAQRQVLLTRQAWGVSAPPAAPTRGRVPFLRPGPITRPPQGLRPGQSQKGSPPRAPVPLPEERVPLEPELEIDIRFDEPTSLEAAPGTVEGAAPAEGGMPLEPVAQARQEQRVVSEARVA
jgi:hypothetical protein